MKEDGVIYAELRFAPQLHTQKEMTQETAIHAALRGLKRAPIPGNLILCCMRGDLNQKENLETLELAKKYLVEDGGVVAIDLAGARHSFQQKITRRFLQKQENIRFHLPSMQARPEMQRM